MPRTARTPTRDRRPIWDNALHQRRLVPAPYGSPGKYGRRFPLRRRRRYLRPWSPWSCRPTQRRPIPRSTTMPQPCAFPRATAGTSCHGSSRGGTCRHGTLMQPADGVERRRDRSFLPTADVRGVLARQHDAAIDGAQIVVVIGAGIGGPQAEATHGERRSVPGHGHAVVELLRVLWVNLAAVFHRLAHPLL